MKIIINTAHQRFGGAVQVALSFIYECRNFPENEYHVFVGPGVRKSLNEKTFPRNFFFYHFDFGIINFKTTFKINSTLKRYEKDIKPDCIISTAGPTYFKSRARQIIGYNLGLYIYFDSPYHKRLSFYKKARMLLKKQLHFYYFKRDAEAFVVQTDDVNQRVRKAFNTDKVFTVTNTVNSFYDNWEKYPAKLAPRGKNEIRFITISSYYSHKNLEIIPSLSDVLKKRGYNNIKFVVTLDDESFKTRVNPLNDENIINVGPVKQEECPSLYNECDFMFLPTLAECFSASYPEAMKMEKPIVTTDLGFARSICGEAALFYEPMNPEDAAAKIELLINDKELQQKLIEKGKEQLKKFDTPESRARKYLELCEKIITKIRE